MRVIAAVANAPERSVPFDKGGRLVRSIQRDRDPVGEPRARFAFGDMGMEEGPRCRPALVGGPRGELIGRGGFGPSPRLRLGGA